MRFVRSYYWFVEFNLAFLLFWIFGDIIFFLSILFVIGVFFGLRTFYRVTFFYFEAIIIGVFLFTSFLCLLFFPFIGLKLYLIVVALWFCSVLINNKRY